MGGASSCLTGAYLRYTYKVANSQPHTATMNVHRKLLILGNNQLLEKGLIRFEYTEEESRGAGGYITTVIAGETSIVNWDPVGSGELRISVWWKFNIDNHPQANLNGAQQEKFLTSSPLAKSQHYPKFVGATASGWLERERGRYLMGKGSESIFEKYLRKGEKQVLEMVPTPAPNGYKAEGKFIF